MNLVLWQLVLRYDPVEKGNSCRKQGTICQQARQFHEKVVKHNFQLNVYFTGCTRNFPVLN